MTAARLNPSPDAYGLCPITHKKTAGYKECELKEKDVRSKREESHTSKSTLSPSGIFGAWIFDRNLRKIKIHIS